MASSPRSFPWRFRWQRTKWDIGEAAKTIIEPTNASRVVLKKLLAESGMQHIIGKGYYAFMNVGECIKAKGWADTEPLASTSLRTMA